MMIPRFIWSKIKWKLGGEFILFTSMEDCTNFMYRLRAEKHKGEPFRAMNAILPLLKNPHEKVPFIHIAGSNGKGSTVNYLREILQTAGYKVGAFTSPHLERVNERISINGSEISDGRFLALANRLFRVIEEELDGDYPNFFELMTLIAFQYFAEEQVDIALIEAGIGGRFDCTNVISPLCSIITTVSLDHTHILGNSYKEIAYQKAGIIKRNVPVITAVANKEALEVICREARQQHAPLFLYGEDFFVSDIQTDERKQNFAYHLGNVHLNITLKMMGAHQIANAGCAITAATILRSIGFAGITDKIIQTALEKAFWPGRFERVGSQIILDGSHNPEGTEALIHTLKRQYPDKKYKFIYSVMEDKDYHKSIAMIDKVAHAVYFTELPVPRAAKAEELAHCSGHPDKAVNKDWKAVVEQEMSGLQEDELLVVTGSIFFIAEVRKFLKAKEEAYDYKF